MTNPYGSEARMVFMSERNLRILQSWCDPPKEEQPSLIILPRPGDVERILGIIVVDWRDL